MLRIARKLSELSFSELMHVYIEGNLKNGKELSVPKSRYREVKKQYANHLDLLGKWCSPD